MGSSASAAQTVIVPLGEQLAAMDGVWWKTRAGITTSAARRSRGDGDGAGDKEQRQLSTKRQQCKKRQGRLPSQAVRRGKGSPQHFYNDRARRPSAALPECEWSFVRLRVIHACTCASCDGKSMYGTHLPACLGRRGRAARAHTDRLRAPTIALLLLLIWSPVSVTQTAVDPGLLCEGKHGCYHHGASPSHQHACAQLVVRRSGTSIPGTLEFRLPGRGGVLRRDVCGGAHAASPGPYPARSEHEPSGRERKPCCCCCLGPFAGGLALVSLVLMLPVIASLQPAASDGHAQGQGQGESKKSPTQPRGRNTAVAAGATTRIMS